jgi:hypothetical protein
MYERPSGSSHVGDGGGAAQGLDQTVLDEEMTRGRGSGQLVEFRPYWEVDCQWAFNFQARLGFEGHTEDSMENKDDVRSKSQESEGTEIKKGCMVFAYHTYPGLTSARYQGRSWFAEDSWMVGLGEGFRGDGTNPAGQPINKQQQIRSESVGGIIVSIPSLDSPSHFEHIAMNSTTGHSLRHSHS